MAAPLGNQNNAKGKLFQQALKRALSRLSDTGSVDGLDKVCDRLVRAAVQGESWAIKEIGDRIDGKPAQSHELSGPEGGPIDTRHTVEFLDGSSTATEKA